MKKEKVISMLACALAVSTMMAPMSSSVVRAADTMGAVVVADTQGVIKAQNSGTPETPIIYTVTDNSNSSLKQFGHLVFEKTVEHGKDLVITVQPKEGCRLIEMGVNDKDVTNEVVNNTYTLKNVTGNVKVAASFGPIYVEPTHLGEINITIDEPVAGQSLNTNIKDITICDIDGNLLDMYVPGSGNIIWLDQNENRVNKAEAGQTYIAALHIPLDFSQAEDFGECIVRINGEEVTYRRVIDIMYLRRTFAKLPDATTPVPPTEESKPVPPVEEVVPPTEETKPSYEITDGNGSQWNNTSKDGLTFRSTADLNKFVAVKVDGQTVDSKHYALKEGSTIVTLSADYLKTLKSGTHTLTVVSKDGEASTEFTTTHTHVVSKFETKNATCTKTGVKKHYECECGAWFEDAEGKKEITDRTVLNIPALGHKPSSKFYHDQKNHWNICSVCGAHVNKATHTIKEDATNGTKICTVCKCNPNVPKTDDNTNIAFVLICMMVSALGITKIAFARKCK